MPYSSNKPRAEPLFCLSVVNTEGCGWLGIARLVSAGWDNVGRSTCGQHRSCLLVAVEI